MVAARLDGSGRDKQLDALVDDGEADVDVVEEHVRRPVAADVLDLVVDPQARLADPRLDAPPQQQVLAEDAAWSTSPSAQRTQSSPSQRSP